MSGKMREGEREKGRKRTKGKATEEGREKRFILGRIFYTTLKSSGIYGVLAPLYYLAEGLFPAAETVLYAEFFDRAAVWVLGSGEAAARLSGSGESAARLSESGGKMSGLLGGGEAADGLWLCVGLLAGLYLVRSLLAITGSIAINIGVYEKLSAFLKEKLAEKCSRLPLLAFEDAKVHNQCLRAEECVKQEQISGAYMLSIVLFSCLLGVIASGTVLASYSLLIVPLAGISVLPHFVRVRVLGKAFYQMQKKQTVSRRKADYFWQTLTMPGSVRELRMTGASGYMEEKWAAENGKVQKELDHYRRREARYASWCAALQTAGTGISIGLTVYLAVRGQISIGELGACISAYSRLQDKVREFFAESGKLQEKLRFAEDYFSFMALAEEKDGETRLGHFPEEIRLENLSFRYPGGAYPAVDGVNLTIHKGESLVIVGENGSGKTTLTRLIAGLYPPEKGQVLWEGKRLQDIRREDAARWISMIDQRFIRYLLTLRENVGISFVEKMGDDRRIRQSLKEAGLESLNEELDDVVGKLFGGRDFSGGQWQRIAIARGLFRPGELFLLDEPTSALDPVLEAEILQKFLQVLKEKTCIIVSHRVGLCRYADRVVVMKKGKIKEVGSHEELYARKGEYWKIYNSQSQWYQQADVTEL